MKFLDLPTRMFLLPHVIFCPCCCPRITGVTIIFSVPPLPFTESSLDLPARLAFRPPVIVFPLCYGSCWSLGCWWLFAPLWSHGWYVPQILFPAGVSRSLPHLAITSGFKTNCSGLRGYRLGIDASIWFFHAKGGCEGENPELRTLFFKCADMHCTTLCMQMRK